MTTSGWLAGAALDWTAPDLSTVAGWDSQWDPTTALDMEWYVTAEIATLPVEDLLDLDFTVPKAAWDGRVLEIAERSGTIAATP